jgi:hypothetical protein
VHITSVPGAVYRGDSDAEVRQLRSQHLRAYLACGVTTVLDTGSAVGAAREIQAWLDAGHPGPRVLWLAPSFTTANGYLTEGTASSGMFLPPTSSSVDVVTRFEESAELKAVGVKVFLESGFGTGCWPTHSPEIRDAIRSEAAKHKLPIYVHSTNEADHHAALDMGANVIAHSTNTASDGVITRLRDRSAYVMSTLSIADSWLMSREPERLEDSLVRDTVPSVELATARDPDAWTHLIRTFAEWIAPNAVNAVADGIDSNLYNSLAEWQASVRKLHGAGIPVVMGTDSGNWPLIPYEFHGPTTLREIELLGNSGLSAMEAIQASTVLPARMLGLSTEIGSVEVGKQADLTLVEGNPLEDLRALRNIHWTVKGGIAKSPREWMDTRNSR